MPLDFIQIEKIGFDLGFENLVVLFAFFFFFLLRVIFYILKCLPELQVVFLSVCFLINGSFIYLTEYCYLFLMSVN